MKLYVYCIAEGGERVRNLPRGVFGTAVRVLKFDGLAALVSPYRGEAFTNRINEAAVTHHNVVRTVQKQTTSLPVRFGAIVTEQQLRNYIATHRQAIKANLAHVRGRVEMNVRMSGTIAAEAVAESPMDHVQAGPGTAFLLEKRKDILRDEGGAQQKAVLAAWFQEKLGNIIKDEHISLALAPSHKAFLARADHLVDREAVQQYREQIATAIAERPEIHFMVSGPWPPYSFANIELEFKSHFGVS